MKTWPIGAAVLLVAGWVAANEVWVADLGLGTMSQGYGSPQRNKTVVKHPLNLAGQTFEHGVGTHAESIFGLNLQGEADRFTAVVGVDDEVKGTVGSVEFKVTADGKEVFKSGLKKAGMEPSKVDVDLKGVKNLLLEVTDAGDGIKNDHADWANAKITYHGAKPSAGPPPKQSGIIAGSGRSGLIFRLLWVESTDEHKRGVIKQFVLSAGAPYGSQEIRRIVPLQAGQLKQGEDQHSILTYRVPMAVLPNRPMLLGFLVEATQYPDAFLTPASEVQTQRLPHAEQFLKDEKEYDLHNPTVQKLARTLTQGNPDPETLMRRVWEHIHGHMANGGVRRPNTGAEVLEWGKGACGEYARVTATVLRACGIPAREVHSVYCNPSGLTTADHGWAEAFLPNFGWVPMHTQSPLPSTSKYWFGSVNSYVIYRGLGVRHFRKIEGEGVQRIGDYGIGKFVSMSPDECTKTIMIVTKLSNDDGTQAPQLLETVSSMPNQVQPLLYWLFSASPNDNVGKYAAIQLAKAVTSKEWESFLSFSPTVARRRLEAAAK